MNIFLYGSVVVGVNSIQVSGIVNIVPHVVFCLNMMIETLHEKAVVYK